MSRNRNNALPGHIRDAMLEALEPVDPGAAASGRILDNLKSRIAVDRSKDALTTVAAETGDWFEPVPGNAIKVLRQDDESMSMLVRLEPGTVFPAHFHPADEETYVVEGETWFGDIHLKAGDYHLAPKGTTHGEVTTETGCLLLIRKSSED